MTTPLMFLTNDSQLNTNPSSIILDTQFQGLNSKSSLGLREWLTKTYFHPQNNNGDLWYDAKVNASNVLEHISNKKNLFPQTPKSIMEVWAVIPSLRKELNALVSDDKLEKPEIYTRGEKTLSVIGQAIGGISAMMVNKISDGAVIKLTRIAGELSSEDMEVSRKANERIDMSILNTAEIWADAISTGDTVDSVLEGVITAGILTKKDIDNTIDGLQTECLMELIEYRKEGASQSDLEDVFIEDLKKPVNIFNMAQLMVSRQVFPPAKKGRPKGSKSSDKSEFTEFPPEVEDSPVETGL